MHCVNKTSYLLCLQNYKKNRFEADMLVKTYRKGNPDIGVKKNLGKAIKILKYWEKSIEEHKAYYFVYHTLYEIYKEMGKNKQANQYGIKYFSSSIAKEATMLDYYYRSLIDIELDCTIDFKGKIKDKKMANSVIKHYEEYLSVISGTNEIIFSQRNKKLLQLFTDSNFERLYLVHLIKGFYEASKAKESDELLLKFTEEDYASYLKILDYKAFKGHKDFKNYLHMRYLYAKPNCPDDVKLAYAKEVGINGKFTVKNYNLGMNIATDCYEKGNLDAVKVILNLFESAKYPTRLIEFLEKHIKKYKNDIEGSILLADAYFQYFYQPTSGATDKAKIKKAIGIYEKNHSKLKDKQLDLLSNVYLKGHCVEIDLEKAKLYSKSNNEEIQKQERINSFGYLDNLNLKAIAFKSRLKELKNAVIANDNDKIIELINLIDYGYAIEHNDEIINKLANILVENKHPHGLLYFYMTTGDNKYYEALDKEENSYKYYALYLKRILEKADNYLIQEALLKAVEFGDKYVKRIYAIALYNGKYFERNVELSYQIFIELFDDGYYTYGGSFFEMFNIYKREENNLEWLYKHAKNCADETNSPYACYEVYYLNLKLNKMSEADGATYLLRAQQNNHEIATVELAKCYYHGYSKGKIEKNNQKAFELFSKVADTNSRAMYYLGRCYYYGKGTKIDYKKAFSCFTKSYENSPRACLYLGYCYNYGRGVKVDYEKAMKYYQEASKIDEYGLFALAKAYCYGLEGYLAPDYKKSIQLNLEGLKTVESEDAYFVVAYSYKKLKDYKNAEKYYKKVIKINSKYSEALYNLALLYETDEFDGRNYKESMKYYDLAYKAGDIEAALNIAIMKMMANYNMEDEKGAFSYLEPAYKGKVKDSEVYFAYYYQHYKDDEKEAYNLIKDSNSENNLRYLVLGNLYYSGKHLSMDYKKAFENYQKAYEIFPENPYAWYRLGRCYYFGHGVERDINRAYDFMSLAAEKDFNEAKEFIRKHFPDK